MKTLREQISLFALGECDVALTRWRCQRQRVSANLTTRFVILSSSLEECLSYKEEVVGSSYGVTLLINPTGTNSGG